MGPPRGRAASTAQKTPLPGKAGPAVADEEPRVLTPFQQMQLKIWVTLDDPAAGLPNKIISMFIMLVIALSVFAFCAGTVLDCEWVQIDPDSPDKERRCKLPTEEEIHRWWAVETFCIAVFTLEYCLRIFSCPVAMGVWRFFWAPLNLVDLCAIVPYYIELMDVQGDTSMLQVLRVIRLTRVLRVFKVGRNMQGIVVLLRTLMKSASALGMLCFFVVVSVMLFSTLVYFCEGGKYDSDKRGYYREDGLQTPFQSILHSAWWCLVTMTTVGYGDAVHGGNEGVWSPITWPGKMVGFITMFCGLIVLSLPITIIGANFDEEYKELRRNQEKQELAVRKLDVDIGQLDPVANAHRLICSSHTEMQRDMEGHVRRQADELKYRIRKVVQESRILSEAKIGDKGV